MPLRHVDEWTDADERALLQLPRVDELMAKAAAAQNRWFEETQDRGRHYRWGQKHPPWEDGHQAPPPSFDERLDVLRKEVRDVRSSVVPFQEPLVYCLDERAVGTLVPLPGSAAAVGPDDRLGVLIYGFDLRPADGETIVAIAPRLRYKRARCLTYAMVPNMELEERFKAETEVELTLGADAAIGIPSFSPAAGIGGSARAGGAVRSGVAWSWRYRVLRARVVTFGTQSDFAEWEIRRDDLVGALELRALLRIPKRVRSLDLAIDGTYVVKKRIAGWKRERVARLLVSRARGHVVSASARS